MIFVQFHFIYFVTCDLNLFISVVVLKSSSNLETFYYCEFVMILVLLSSLGFEFVNL